MSDVPFTVTADLELGSRVEPFVRADSADVRICEGCVPDRLDDASEAGTNFEVSGDRFLLHVPRGASFLVEGGSRITYRRNDTSDRDVALFLLGSAWGALCYQRGLIPLHASAVIRDGQVHAFTGPSGAGKSTLVAALSRSELDFFTDDVLIIDPERIEPGRSFCYAGQKDMKLWKDAFDLTGSDKLGAVRDEPSFEKFFARPATMGENASGLLSSLTILKNENVRRARTPVEIEQISGALALRALRESVYRMRFANAIIGREKLFRTLGALISAVRVQTFDRSLLKSEFENSTAVMREWILDYAPEAR